MDDVDAEGDDAADLQALATSNYGHFTAMLVRDRRIRGLSLHLERLARDSLRLFGAAVDPGTVRARVRHAVAGRPGAYIVRVTVFDPSLHPAEAAPRVLVTTRPHTPVPAGPWRVRSVPYTRDLPEVKHTGLFGALWQRREARRAGYDDALFTGPGGHVGEGPTWNIGFFDGTDVLWPAADVLPGVTMRLLQQAHTATTVTRVPLRTIGAMRAAFATNTAFGVRPVTAVDDTTFPADHPILSTLRDAYERIPAEPV